MIYTFDQPSIRAITDVVRRYMRVPHNLTGDPGERIAHDQVLDAKITAVTSIAGLFWKYTIHLGHWNMASGTATGGTWVQDSATNYYAFDDFASLDNVLAVNQVVQIKPRGADSSGSTYFTIINATVPDGLQNSPSQLGSSVGGSESPSSDTWARTGTTSGTNYAGVPLNVWVITRVVYNNAGDKVLYAMARQMSFDTRGALYAVSAEARINVDAAEACP